MMVPTQSYRPRPVRATGRGGGGRIAALMICRNCGTEIADKAIICYRCGTATTDPVRKPAAVRPRRSGLFSVVGIAALALLGLFLGQAGRTMGPGQGGLLETVAAICVGAALVILVVRIVRRRR